jgi:hypothetical protein
VSGSAAQRDGGRMDHARIPNASGLRGSDGGRLVTARCASRWPSKPCRDAARDSAQEVNVRRGRMGCIAVVLPSPYTSFLRSRHRRPRVLRDRYCNCSLLLAQVTVCAGSAEFSPAQAKEAIIQRAYIQLCLSRRARALGFCSFHSCTSRVLTAPLVLCWYTAFYSVAARFAPPVAVRFCHLYPSPGASTSQHEGPIIITTSKTKAVGGGDTGVARGLVLRGFSPSCAPSRGWPADPASPSFVPPPCPCHCQPSLVQSPSFRYFPSSFAVIAIIVPLHSFLCV